jgi:hypothetical protein
MSTGDAFEFVRNYKFNARNFFALKRDSLNATNTGELGGLILKNKLFFFGGFQAKTVRPGNDHWF